MRVRSIRLRLLLWYLAIFGVIIVLLGASIYVTMRRTLDENLTSAVRARVTILLGLVSYDQTGQPHLNFTPDPNDPNRGESFQRLFDRHGAVVFDNSAAFGDVPIDQSVIQNALRGQEHVSDVGAGDAAARLVTVPTMRGDQIVGVLQAGQATSDLSSTLNSLLLILAIALPSSLVLASLGGWWLSSRALGPIDKVTRMAQEITGHDLSRRLNLDLPDDEVGRLARTFDDMIARLDALFQRQREFTAAASHELRTPLTAIRGQIDVALRRPRDAAGYQRVLAAVSEQTERLSRVVKGLLTLSRSDAGAIPIERSPVSVRSLTGWVAEQMRPLAEQNGLYINVEPGDDVSAAGDEDLLRQLLLNLADNAVKYTREGGVTIGWRAPGDVQLFVQDTGPGIPPEHQERIFERFHRVDPAWSRGQEGAGLGLSICKWIAEAHGGSIGVTSSGTGGSTFIVSLPRYR